MKGKGYRFRTTQIPKNNQNHKTMIYIKKFWNSAKGLKKVSESLEYF